MIRKSSPILMFGSTDPTVHETARTAFLAPAFPDRPAESWRFARMTAEFNGPFMTLMAYVGDSYRVFYTRERTAELMALLRESHALAPDQGRVTLLAIPARWHADRHWKRHAADGVELITYSDDSGPDGAIAALTLDERGALIAAHDAVNTQTDPA